MANPEWTEPGDYGMIDCPECCGDGWVIGTDSECCGGSDYECGGRGCSGPVQVQVQEQCEYCRGDGKVDQRHVG